MPFRSSAGGGLVRRAVSHTAPPSPARFSYYVDFMEESTSTVFHGRRLTLAGIEHPRTRRSAAKRHRARHPRAPSQRPAHHLPQAPHHPDARRVPADAIPSQRPTSGVTPSERTAFPASAACFRQKRRPSARCWNRSEPMGAQERECFHRGRARHAMGNRINARPRCPCR